MVGTTGSRLPECGQDTLLPTHLTTIRKSFLGLQVHYALIVLGGPRVGSLLGAERGPTSNCLEFSTRKKDNATWSESSPPSLLTIVSEISVMGGPEQFPGMINQDLERDQR